MGRTVVLLVLGAIIAVVPAVVLPWVLGPTPLSVALAGSERQTSMEQAAAGTVAGALGSKGDWSFEGRTVELLRDRSPVAEASVDANNRFVFEAVPPDDEYTVQLAGVDYGPLSPCSDPQPFNVGAGQTATVAIYCWR